jgi:hypothetical protein
VHADEKTEEFRTVSAYNKSRCSVVVAGIAMRTDRIFESLTSVVLHDGDGSGKANGWGPNERSDSEHWIGRRIRQSEVG